MPREIDQSIQIVAKDPVPIPQILPLRDLVLMYIIWFFLSGLTAMTRQLVFEGTVLLTQGVHYLFFITFRLLFIPAALYFIIYRHFLTAERVGLTFKNFWRMSRIGFRIGIPFIPLTLLLVHLPLIYNGGNLKPMMVATSLDTIVVSLVYSFLLFFMTLIPAFSEELLFRGLTFSFLQERLGTVGALFLSSLVYGLFYMQFNLYMFFIRFVLGFFASYLFWRSKSLIPSAFLQGAFHAGMNLYVLGLSWW